MTTRNTNILCPNCSQAYTYGAEFCGNCGMRLTAVDRPTFPMEGNTPIPPPPLYQQFSSSRLSYTQPVVPKPPFWTRGKIIVLTVTILLLLLLIGGGLISFAYQLGRITVSGGVSPQTTTAPGTTPIATEPPTAPPSPTPTPKVITENLNIVCLDCGSYAAMVKLNTITIDYSNHQTTMKFTIKNIGAVSCDVVFVKLELQDDNGTIFKAQNVGQTLGNIAIGNPLIVNSIFDLLPRHNIHYLLNSAITCNYSMLNALDYKTQDFVFN